MHLRRALLLFAIVLGFAALAASVAPPPEDGGEETTATGPTAPTPQPPSEPSAGGPAELRFVSGTDEPERRRIETGERAVVTVAVQEPGDVEIAGLGLLQTAEPGTPARFDVLVSRPGRYEITYRPVDGNPVRVGILEVAGGA